MNQRGKCPRKEVKERGGTFPSSISADSELRKTVKYHGK